MRRMIDTRGDVKTRKTTLWKWPVVITHNRWPLPEEMVDDALTAALVPP